jgi:putative ABC transport system permease protein
MIKNFFKTAWRNLLKNKMHSLINITGLSAGMAVAILIGLWMYDEISFNRNFRNHDQIAQVIQNVTNNGEVQTWKSVPFPLADELRKNYGSDFRYVVMAVNGGDHMVTIDDKKLTASGIFMEKDAPRMFSMDMLRGNRHGLDDPSSILVSASAAKSYFDDDDPMGKTIKIDNLPPLKVSGVYKDFPRNSNFADLNFIAPWEFLYNNSDWMKTSDDPWRPNFTTLFVQLNDHTDIKAVSARIRDAKLKKVNPKLAQKKPELFLTPMNAWHLYSEYRNGVNIGGAIQYVWMFGIIGLFVLLLACINFMNLSTARSEKRAKEVGIRKTVGSLRKQLILQFFSESVLTAFLAFAISVLLVQLALPFFNDVSGKSMTILWSNPVFWLACMGFTLATGLIAGSYPAFYLSSFRPIKVLKGTFRAGRLAALPRKVLVVLQFSVSVSLIIGTMVVYRQIRFAKDRPVGYTREGLVNIPMATNAIHEHFDAVKTELLHTGNIASIAESQSPPTGIWSSSSGFSWRGKDPNLSIDFGNVSVSYDYGKTIGWKLKEGRDFSRDFATDSAAFILNEAAAEYMGLKNPVGETVTWWDQPYTVIGVIHDMVTESPYEEARPVIYNLSNDGGNVAIVKINSSVSVSDAVASITATFKKFNPEQPFEYRFVDEEYARKFSNEERVGKLAGFFAILAIAISCLGLFGLASFVAEQRSKEIGIRKVLGASIPGIWNLLSKGFVRLVLLSFLISIPVSYYFMHNWLMHFQYRSSITWWIFALAGAGSLLITLIVVSMQAIKAALANPIRSLRME